MNDLEACEAKFVQLTKVWRAEQVRGNRLSARLSGMKDGPRKLFRRYGDLLKGIKGIPEERSEDGLGLAHARWMCDESWGMDDPAKLHRWLGYVQCILVSSGRFTLDDVRDHSRGLDT